MNDQALSPMQSTAANLTGRPAAFIPADASSNEERARFDIANIMNVLRRRYAFLISIVMLLTGFFVLVMLQMTPRYTAEVVLLLDRRKEQVVDIQAVVSGLPADSAATRSEVDVLASRYLIGKVVDKTNLANEPEFNPVLKGFTGRISGMLFWLTDEEKLQVDNWLRGTLGSLTAGDKSPEQVQAELRAQIVDAYIERLTISFDGRSYTIRLAFQSQSPRLAALIANTHADVYLQSQLENKFDAQRKASVWLAERADGLKRQVEEAEGAVQRYRERNDLVDAKGVTVTAQQMIEQNTQLTLATADRAQREARLRQVQGLIRSGGDINSVPEVLASPTIQRLREQETLVQRREAELVTRYGDRHPTLINTRSELKDLRTKITEEVQKIAIALRNDVDASMTRERALRQNLDQLTGRQARLNQAEVQLRELERLAEVNRTLYTSFLNRLKETTTGQDILNPDARVVSPAEAPVTPSFPKYTLFGVIGLMLSTMIATGLVFLLEILDNAFRSPEEIEKATGVPGIGLIPRLPGSRESGVENPDYLLHRTNSSFAEAIRSLRTNIHFSNLARPPKVIMVASAVPSEGKSLLSLSIARSAAAAGNKVLLVDCDMRRPTQHKLLRMTPQGTLMEHLRGMKTLEEVIQIDEPSGLHTILAHENTPNPQEAIGSPKMREFLEVVRARYTTIVIDTPPVLAVSDAITLSRLVDAIVFAVRWDQTPRQVVVGGIKSLQDVSAPLAGVVLTRVNVRRHAKYGYGDYGYYYGRYGAYYSE